MNEDASLALLLSMFFTIVLVVGLLFVTHIKKDPDVWRAMRMCPPGMQATYEGGEMTGCIQVARLTPAP